MFGEECVDFSDGRNISVTVDGKTVLICLETRVRVSQPDTLRHRSCIWCSIVLNLSLNSSGLLRRCATRTSARRTTRSERWWSWRCSGSTTPSTRSSEDGHWTSEQDTFIKKKGYLYKVNEELVLTLPNKCSCGSQVNWDLTKPIRHNEAV